MMKRLWAALLCIMMLLPGASSAGELLRVHQMQLGCADGFLFQTDGKIVLIDGGRDTGHAPEVVLDYLTSLGVEKIDVHILSHYHMDHAGNVREISERFGHEDTIVYGPSESLPEEFGVLPHGTYRPMVMGDSFTIGETQFLCTGPAKLKKNGYDNLDSLNVLVTHGDRRMLFTGDFLPGESIPAFREELRNVDLLKFPHHGMKSLCVHDWVLKHVNAQIILIPGPMRFHVGNKTFELNQNPDIYTNGDAHLVVLTDGQRMEVRKNVPLTDALAQVF